MTKFIFIYEAFDSGNNFMFKGNGASDINMGYSDSESMLDSFMTIAFTEANAKDQRVDRVMITNIFTFN
ncbi:hypothetical protein [Morganella morganii]|uniref:hypothetical protein n=1 Tax=Morganella morganii TaxID=582 RepID=UPI0023DDCB19|nr:hypothetical protein [Morganella morganii]MDF2407531.1 hypothetical protein [Morganella morganii]